ncbi:FadR/GntR family transcriptional regulator [Altererythrobacter sp.]|uniref:FadR/GntR family transcriptional regulator n=1 Tax=Altererythrobacter sp. TaxID=1872480 RepID=UPI003D145235
MAKKDLSSGNGMIDLGQSEELRVPKTAEIVADRIRKRIIAGELAEGDSLPPEGQLMEQFGISRPTLREAFRILETERLIAVSRGSRTGARVSPPQVSSVSRYASYVLQSKGVRVPDIFEARLAIELFVVRRLSRDASKARIARLRGETNRLEALNAAGETRAFIVGLTEFHQVLVEVGGNQTLLFVMQMLQNLMQEVHLRLLTRHREDSAGDARKAVKSLDRLIDLIEAGDAEEAARHWRLHLINANKKVPYEGTLLDLLNG